MIKLAKSTVKKPKKDEFAKVIETISKKISKQRSMIEKNAKTLSDLQLIHALAMDKNDHRTRADQQPLLFNDYKEIIDNKLKYLENNNLKKFNSEIIENKRILFDNFEIAALLSTKIEINHKELEQRLNLNFEFGNNGYMMTLIPLLLLDRKNKNIKLGS